MSEPQPSDPLDALRRADPVRDVNRLPSASLDRVRARVMEDLTPARHKPASRHRSWRPRVAVGLVATAGAIAIAVAMLGRGTTPGLGPDPSGPPQVGACVEIYSLETLPHRIYAFDGTVASITGEEVKFRVNQAFRGVGVAEVTLTATGMTGTAITPGEGPSLSVGERYLVAGDDRFVWGCGFTQPYDTAVAASWANVLGS